MNATVTFDSNVWEIIVDKGKRDRADSVYAELHALILSGKITPFFFEGIATMETVRKTDRKDYIGEHQIGYRLTVNGQVFSSSQGSSPPALSSYHKEMIPEALIIGFRFLRFPRIGAPSLCIEKHHWAPDEKFSLNERLNRSHECVRFIESLGAGQQVLKDHLGKGDLGLVRNTKEDSSTSEAQYAKACAEWIDGDALAAHYGYGIDYFCTNDQGSGAGSSSIFSAQNLKKLEDRFPVNVVSPMVLVKILKG